MRFLTNCRLWRDVTLIANWCREITDGSTDGRELWQTRLMVWFGWR